MRNGLFILLLFVFGLTACFDDESSLGTIEVGGIEIDGLPEKEVSIISYNGNILQVSPDVKAGYPESAMKYAWYIYGGALEQKSDFRTYRIDKAGEKDLAYEVNLPSGAYTVVFEATAPNSYAKTATFDLSVSTPFSQGFYILKETADGNTELDLLTDDGLVSNLMQSVVGTTLTGKPLGVGVTYSNGYIDEADHQEMKADNMVYVFAEQDYRGFRTEDMYQTFSRENLMFDPVADEVFGTVVMGGTAICFFSNKGFYSSGTGASSGKLGVPVLEGNFRLPQAAVGGNVLIFWNEETHSLYEKNDGELIYDLPAGFVAENLECLTSGLNYSASGDVAWFLCQDKNNGKRLLLVAEVAGDLFFGIEIDVQAQVVPAGSHLANGNVFAGNGLDASAIYVVDDNKLYFCTLDLTSETLFSLQGIEGEINYVSNNYLNRRNFMSGRPLAGNFNYLVVATRIGNGYKLYLYDNLVGGIPTGEAKKVVEGTGTVSDVRYLSTVLTSTDIQMNLFYYNGPIFP